MSRPSINPITNFFLDVSGVNRFLLDKGIATVNPQEIMKQAMMGVLLFVPAILGFFGLFTFLVTFPLKDQFFVSGTVALVYASVIFVIDRLLVISIRKKPTVGQTIASVSVIARLVFSLILGIIIAEPMLWFFFQKAIKDTIRDQAKAKVELLQKERNAVQSKFDHQISHADSALSFIAYYKSKELLTEGVKNGQGLYVNQVYTQCPPKNAYVDCNTFRVGKMHPDTEKRFMETGDTNVDCNKNPKFCRIKEIEKNVKRKKAEFEALKASRIKEYTKKIDDQEVANTENLDMAATSKGLEDYLSQKNLGSQGTIIETAVRLFFILLDLLPILLKITLPYSDYDSRLLQDDNRRKERAKKSEEETKLAEKVIEHYYDLRYEKFGQVMRNYQDNPKASIHEMIQQLEEKVGVDMSFTLGIEQAVVRQGYHQKIKGGKDVVTALNPRPFGQIQLMQTLDSSVVLVIWMAGLCIGFYFLVHKYFPDFPTIPVVSLLILTAVVTFFVHVQDSTRRS